MVFSPPCTAALETAALQRKFSREADGKSREKLLSHGMKVNEISAEERARMREKIAPVIEKYKAEIGPELITEFYAELNKIQGVKK